MKIIKTQITSEHAVETDAPEWPEFVRRGPGNWWRWIGSSLEACNPGLEDEMERLFLENEKDRTK